MSGARCSDLNSHAETLAQQVFQRVIVAPNKIKVEARGQQGRQLAVVRDDGNDFQLLVTAGPVGQRNRCIDLFPAP